MNTMTYEMMVKRLEVMGIRVIETEKIHYDYEGQDECVRRFEDIIDIAQESTRPVVFCSRSSYESEFVAEVANQLYGNDAMDEVIDREVIRLMKANPYLDIEFVIDSVEAIYDYVQSVIRDELHRILFLSKQTEYCEFVLFNGSEAYSYTTRVGEDLLGSMEKRFNDLARMMIMRMDECAASMICTQAA